MTRSTQEAGEMRIVLADDHKDVRNAIRLLLEQDEDTNIPGEAAAAGELLAGAVEWQPDLVLLDWELPGMPADAVLRELRALCPGVAVVALSGLPESRCASLAAGADAFVSKAEPPERLVTQMRACFGGASASAVEDPAQDITGPAGTIGA